MQFFCLALQFVLMHDDVMRTHTDIVRSAGATADLAERYGVSVNTIRAWIARDKVPDEYWAAFHANGHATLDELAYYAAIRRQGAAA